MLKSDEPSTSTPSPTSTLHPAGPSAGGNDDLSHLHKMSRTAGLGGNDYVAVNGVAVAALIFGLASAAIVFNTIFLVVPVVAVVLAFIAIRQIRNSNGTQTGTPLAVLGLLAALGCGAFLGGQRAMEAMRARQDGERIATVVRAFGADISAKNYDAAYARTTDTFRSRVPKETFVERFDQLQASPYYGRIKSMDWNQLVQFDVDPVTLEPIAHTNALLEFENVRGMDTREIVAFRKAAGEWQIEDLPGVFPRQPDLVQDDRVLPQR